MTGLREAEKIYSFPVYPKRDLVLVKGENAAVFDENGREYIDCVAGNGSLNVGHSNPAVVKAVKDQAEKIISCANIFYNDARAAFLEKLISVMPAGLRKAFLCNSGAEAVEAAVKFSRLATKRKKFVSTVNGFHGRTLGALSATHNSKYREDFLPLLDGFSFVPYNDFEKMERAVDLETAGVIVETVQGEGGVYPGRQDYFERLRRLCTEQGALLIIDEVQTGFCRTGKFFGFEHFGVAPDILCLAKSIAGGLPMGAVAASDQIEVGIGKHGSTFGGNPLCCAAGTAAIEFMLENKLWLEAERKGSYLMERLRLIKSSKIREVRGLGLMIGIELKEKAKPYVLDLLERGLLVLPSGLNIIRLLPPLTIPRDDIDRVIERIAASLGDKEKSFPLD